MVANAPHDPGNEGRRIFDIGYLVAVSVFLLLVNGFPLFQFLVHGNPHVVMCQSQGQDHITVSPLMIIGTAFCFLLLIFTFLISVRTRKNLNISVTCQQTMP